MALPVFKGENYDFWCTKMKTMLRSQDLWDLVEEYTDVTPENMKDSKALFFVQQAIDDSIFSHIAAATKSKVGIRCRRSIRAIRRDLESNFRLYGVSLRLLLCKKMKMFILFSQK